MANLLANAGAWGSFWGIVLAILILLGMITIHEFGHYLAGKILGFKINEFSIGFGPALFKKRSKKTGEIFALRIIPLGGYCAFDGEDEIEDKKTETDGENGADAHLEEDVPASSEQLEENLWTEVSEKEDDKKKETEYPEPKGERFNDRAPWRRIIVLVAGALMNYLLALLLIIVMFGCYGRPVYQVVKETPSENASEEAWAAYNNGLENGDIILEIEGKDLYLLTDYMSVLDGKKKGDTVKVLVIRNGKKQKVDVTLAANSNPKSMSDGNSIVYPLGLRYYEKVTDEEGKTEKVAVFGGGFREKRVKDGVFGTIGHSFAYSFKLGGMILRSLGELITGKLGMESVGGPITTIKVTSAFAGGGFQNFLWIASFIGVNLAVFNLLPVPALDGCKVIFCLIEWIFKKPVNRTVEAIINFVGFVALFGFAILVDFLQFLPW